MDLRRSRSRARFFSPACSSMESQTQSENVNRKLEPLEVSFWLMIALVGLIDIESQVNSFWLYSGLEASVMSLS